ncbi:MAG TPA: WD40 repeat domain-containing protein, partial [Gemmataceae bacterium]|nr:WD40 repeat domain-containing protein [Gemmataceae bacterium]
YLHRQCHAELVAIHGHVGPITALAVSPDGNLIAGASQTMADTTPIAFDLKVWDATSGKLTRELFGHQAVTVGVAFSPDGTLLASTSNDKTIRLWEVRSGREVLKITTNVVARRVAFSPDGTRLAAVAGPQILFFDAERGTELFGLSGHTGNVFVLAFSADGQRLVTAGADRLVKVWDLATRKEAFSCRGHTGEIADVAFSPKKDQIISSGRGSGATVRRGEVRLWSAADGKPAPVNMTLPFPVTGAGFTANPGQIACAGLDGDVRFLDATRGTTTFTLHGQSAAVRNLVVTRDGTRVVTGLSDRTIRVWSVRNPEFVELPLNMSAFVPLAFSPDGTRLAGNYFDLEAKRNPPRGVQVVAVSPGAPGPVDIRPTKGTVAALSFAPDRRWLAGAELTGVHLWERDNLAASRFLAEFGVWDLSVSPDGQYLATATRDPDVDPRPDLGDDFMTNIVTMRTRLAIPPQQTVPAIKVWRVADGGLEYSLPGQMSVSFSPDGRHVAGARANTVVLWDATTGQELRTLSGPTEPVLKVQFTATGRRVAGFTYHRATVWDTHTGRIMAAVDGLKGPAFITPDGRRIVDLHGGSTIKWWDVQLGRELLFLPLPEGSARALAIALSADGRRVATSSGNKLFLWEAGPP